MTTESKKTCLCIPREQYYALAAKYSGKKVMAFLNALRQCLTKATQGLSADSTELEKEDRQTLILTYGESLFDESKEHISFTTFHTGRYPMLLSEMPEIILC